MIGERESFMSALSEMKATSLMTVKCILFFGITVIIFNYFFFLIVIKREFKRCSELIIKNIEIKERMKQCKIGVGERKF